MKLMVDQVIVDANEFREVVLSYSIQEVFKLDKIKNESSRVTIGCKADDFKWRVHTSETESKVYFPI